MLALSKEEKMPTCPVSQLRKLYTKTLMLEDSAKISLELLLTACFPSVWENIKKAMSDNYMQGYLDGKKEGKNEN